MDQDPGVMFVPAPAIHFIAAIKDSNGKIQTGKKNEAGRKDRARIPVSDDNEFNTYECPVYKTELRAGQLLTTGHSTNFILPIVLSSSQDPSYWVLKGAALITMLSD